MTTLKKNKFAKLLGVNSNRLKECPNDDVLFEFEEPCFFEIEGKKYLLIEEKDIKQLERYGYKIEK